VITILRERTPLPQALLLLDPELVPAPARARLEALVVPTWSPSGLTVPIETGERLDRFDVLVTGARSLSTGELSRLPRLQLIVATGTSFHYIDHDYCRARGITLCNTPGYTGPAVAEHAFALLLNLARHILELDASVRSGEATTHLGCDIAGKTVGIVGLGDVGKRVARLARAFDTKVLFVNRGRVTEDGATQVGLYELLENSDFVFLTVPLTARTRHLLDWPQLQAMKPTARVINVSAEELINPSALREALRKRVIAGAALDIVAPGARYCDVPNLIVTPGTAWYTAECLDRRAATWIATIAAFLEGEPTNVVLKRRS
jgi:phosphoglycerate dehydrogenase-like enzyme